MHDAAYAYVARTLRSLNLPRYGSVVDLGGRNVNGTLRVLFPRRWSYTAVDLLAGDGVDVVADAAEWQPAKPVELVLCTEVFEHTPDAGLIAENAHRMLVPGGALIVTTASPCREPHSAIDGGPLRAGEFYRNVSTAMLARWLEQFPLVKGEVNAGTCDLYALALK